MADGDKLLDADGNVVLDDDGNIILSDGAGDDCCCAPVGTECDDCATGTTPTEITVTCVGVRLCPGCPFLVRSLQQISSHFSAVACLPQVGTCAYALYQPIGSLFSATFDWRADGFCGLLDALPFTHIHWQVARTGFGAWSISIDAVAIGGDHTFLVPLFEGDTDSDFGDCGAFASAPINGVRPDEGCPEPGDPIPYGGSGGSASILAGCN